MWDALYWSMNFTEFLLADFHQVDIFTLRCRGDRLLRGVDPRWQVMGRKDRDADRRMGHGCDQMRRPFAVQAGTVLAKRRIAGRSDHLRPLGRSCR